MLTLFVITCSVWILAALVGAPLSSFLVSRLGISDRKRGPIVLAVSIAGGFALSAIASSWSYGLIGADYFLHILVAIFTLSVISAFAIPGVRSTFKIWKEFNKADVSILLLPIYAVLLAKPYWEGLTKLRIAAGGGPDIPQNLMTVLAQRRNGSTWFEARENFLNFLGEKNLADAVYYLYQLPSMQDQAGYDYMVYGTRWGLSVPFAQVLRIDQRWLIAEQGMVVAVGLASLALIIYAFSTLMGNRHFLRNLLAIGSISSAAFLVQAFNGGMAQAWSLAGLGLLSFSYVVAIISRARGQWNRGLLFSLSVLAGFGWLGNAVTYIDSSMTMGAVFLASTIFLYFLSGKANALESLKVVILGGIGAALLVAPFAYAAIHTMPIRLTLAAGTGIQFNNWPLPSEILGIFDVWTQNMDVKRDPLILLIGVIISSSLFYFVARGIKSRNVADKALSALGIAIFLVGAGIAIWASQTGIRSNYSYVKVSTYMAPLLIMIISEKFAIKSGSNANKAKLSTLRGWNGLLTPFVFVLAAGATAIGANNSLFKKAEFAMPSQQLEMLVDTEAQREIDNYNYLTTYRAISNLMGVIGNTHWISKAPNDQRLETRLDKELRVICFAADTACNPPAGELNVPALNKYGLRVFNSTISIQDFANLEPRARYDAAMESVGQPKFEVPERFIGGNPLLKTDE